MWFKVDDGFCDHAKVIKLTSVKGWEKSLALWTLAGSWSGKQESDGNVPSNVVKRLGFSLSDAQRLVYAGLWEEIAEGFVFHDWAKINPLKVELEARRKANKERISQHRNKRASTHAVTLLQSEHEQHPLGRVGSGSEFSFPDRVEPKPIPEPDGSDAGHWLQAFGRAWAEKTGRLCYGQGSDAKACGSMAVTLEAMGAAEIAKAWERRAALFASFFADTSLQITKAGHIFAFFVPRFTALTMAAAPRKSEYRNLAEMD